jgi:hypothetical protein
LTDISEWNLLIVKSCAKTDLTKTIKMNRTIHDTRCMMHDENLNSASLFCIVYPSVAKEFFVRGGRYAEKGLL